LNLTELFLISLGLSMDCFAVSLICGSSRKLSWHDVLRMSFLFGLFQGVMPLLGWVVGSSLLWLIEPVDHWIAFAILAFIGIKMIWQSFMGDEQKNALDIKKFMVLISLSFATSVDALITGVGFGFIRVNILEAVAIISVVTFIVSVTGARLGARTTFLPARWAEFAGGIVLIAIGCKMLMEHLSAT
jgi:manganese efflux pump family protein